MVPGKAEQESTPLKKDENDQSIDVQEDMTGFTDTIIILVENLREKNLWVPMVNISKLWK